MTTCLTCLSTCKRNGRIIEKKNDPHPLNPEHVRRGRGATHPHGSLSQHKVGNPHNRMGQPREGQTLSPNPHDGEGILSFLCFI